MDHKYFHELNYYFLVFKKYVPRNKTENYMSQGGRWSQQRLRKRRQAIKGIG